MDDFKGSKCIVCGNAFTETDDIVVCPECGTPYHRACYKSVGHCVNDTLHESRESWKPDIDPVKTELTDTLCARCGKQNSENALFCEACGFPLKSFIKTEKQPFYRPPTDETGQDNLFLHPQYVNFSDPLCGFNPEEEFDGVKLSEIADYVDKNTHYYLPIFKSFKTFGRYFSWNLTAFLFPELYFAYRKMIPTAVLAFILRMVLLLPNFIYMFSSIDAGELSVLASTVNVSSKSFSALAVIFVLADYIRMWTFSTNANRLYYKKAIHDIKMCKEKNTITGVGEELISDHSSFSGILHKKGGTSSVWLAVFTVLLVIPFLAIGMLASAQGGITNL
jgi:DNA-directed RNA polymerase subunit RPC12/RpoP